MRRSNRKHTTAPSTIASCSCANCQAKWLAFMPTCRLSKFIAHLYRRCSFVDIGELSQVRGGVIHGVDAGQVQGFPVCARVWIDRPTGWGTARCLEPTGERLFVTGLRPTDEVVRVHGTRPLSAQPAALSSAAYSLRR